MKGCRDDLHATFKSLRLLYITMSMNKKANGITCLFNTKILNLLTNLLDVIFTTMCLHKKENKL